MAAAATLAAQILNPSEAPAYSFAFSDFLRKEHRVEVDRVLPNCKDYLQGHCPLGDQCPDKHPRQSNYNK